MKQLIILFFLLTVSTQAGACLNEIQVIPGIMKTSVNEWELVKPSVSRMQLEDFVREMKTKCGDSIGCSDLVIAYLYLGRYPEALELSTRLVAKHPRKYEVVMTHAAALELNGRFKEALAMLKKGMKINPSSHKNSEWMHVKILEQRISGGTESILGLDFGTGKEPVAPVGVDKRKLLVQLQYQLTERYFFIPENDPQFGALLYDFANLLYVNNFKSISQKYYRMATDYGYKVSSHAYETTVPADGTATVADTTLAKDTAVAKAPASPAKPKTVPGRKKTLFIGIALLIGIPVLAGIIRRKTRKNGSRNSNS